MAYGSRSDSGFDSDFTSRFAQMAQAPVPDVSPVLASAFRRNGRDVPSIDERISMKLGQAMGNGDSSLIGYVGSYPEKVAKIVNLMQNDVRNFAEAEAIYKDLQAVSTDNQDELAKMRVFSSIGRENGTPGRVAAAASSLRSGAFNEVPVKMADGTEATIGQIFGGGGYMANRSNQFERLGFSKWATEDYLGEDPDRARAVGEFMRPALEGRKPGDLSLHPRHLQLDEAANYVSDNYDEMKGLFGTAGTMKLVSAVRSGFLDSGGMTDIMDAVVGYAKRFNPGSLETDGADFVNNLFTSADKLATAAFWNPATGKPDRMNDSDRRFLTLSMIAAMKAIPDDLGPLDFRDRRVQSAVTRMADVFNRTRSEGGDLFSQARSAGRDVVSEMTDYMRAFIADSGLTPDNAIASEEAARRMYTMRILGSPDAVPVADVKTGSKARYADDAANYLGSRSGSSSVDWTMKNVIGDVMSATRPLRLSGKMSEADAFTTVLADPGRSAELEGRIRRRFETMLAGTGRGGRIAAAQMTSALLDTLSSPVASDVFSPVRFAENVIRRGVINPDDPEDRELVDALRTWHLVNVSDKDRFAEARKRAIGVKRSEFYGMRPLSAEAAELTVNEAFQAAMRAERAGNGALAAKIIDRVSRMGWDYEPVPMVDKNGKPTGKYEQFTYDGGVAEPKLRIVERDVGMYIADPTSQAAHDYRMRKANYARQQAVLMKMKPQSDED